MRKPITPFIVAVPAVSDRERKIAHFMLHNARLYLFQGNEFQPRITTHPPTPNQRMLRGSAMQNGPWDMTGVGGNSGTYKEVPWSELQDEQLDSLEWSLIEQFTRLSTL